MGRIIQQNNGKTTVYVTGEDLNLLTGNTNTYFLGIDSITGSFNKRNPDGGVEAIGGGVVSTTYSELVSNILSSGLTVGSFYLITDFKTCYDQPDFDYSNNPITTGNYKQGPVKPLIVLATSNSTISKEAYQSAYPNDKITYDWSFSATEVTNSVAFGRITERIDEFNNRTDYDHREVLFRRYDNYYYKEKDIAKGTIGLIQNTGEVIGTDTEFLNYNIGDYIAIPNSNVTFFEIISISGDTSMVVSGLTIPAVLSGSSFYSAQKDGLTYTQNNISIQYTEHPTFLLGSEDIISNYIGDVATFIDWNENTFLLPNNVFGEDVIGNRIGNGFINNTFESDVEHNVIGDEFENNTIVNDEDFTDNQIAANFRNNLIICDDFNDNVIGDNFNNNKFFNSNNIVDNQIGVGFNNNTIYNNFEDNKIGNGFEDTVIDGSFINNSIRNQFNNNEIFSQFYENSIGDYFDGNTIYSDFYKNEILVNFNNNTIGDIGNLDNFEFYRNYIRNGFNNNTIRQDFQNNQIGTNYQSNEINGDFINNTILNGFNNNTIGYWFWGNTIGNGFNDNRINDDFYTNTIGFNFRNNLISNEFGYNHIGTEFDNNRPSNSNLFGWDDLSTVSARTYNTLLNVVGGGQLGRRLLGKELVMFVSSTSQYFLIKFTQWTQDGNGGGFQYERQEIDSNGNTIGSNVVFTKTNNGSEIDVIIPDVLEITRGNNGGIYNVVSEGSWSGSISPSGTTWNSIYTEPDNGRNFAYNKIGNNFYNNTIGNDFGYGGSQAQGNVINDNFENNVIGEYMYSNIIGNYFQNNTIGDDFEGNSIRNYFANNTIGDDFYDNTINNNFSNNSIGSLFRYNIVKAPNLSNTDFTSASIVYSAYTSEIFTNSLGNYKLSYYDGTDTLIITNVNS